MNPNKCVYVGKNIDLTDTGHKLSHMWVGATNNEQCVSCLSCSLSADNSCIQIQIKLYFLSFICVYVRCIVYERRVINITVCVNL